MKFKKITFSYLPTYKSKDIKSSAANYLGLRHTWLQTRCFRNSYFDLITEKKVKVITLLTNSGLRFLGLRQSITLKRHQVWKN